MSLRSLSADADRARIGPDTDVMLPKIAIVYSSKHGHVREIAERLAAIAAEHEAACTVIDARRAGTAEPDRCGGIVIAGSVHFGRHSRALRRFVERNRQWLSTVPSAFISVSAAAASLDGRAEAVQYMEDFFRVTGWRPDSALSAAGAVQYTKYDPLTRLIMRFASRTAGRETDLSHDYVYTDWNELGLFMDEFVGTLERYTHAAAPDTPFSRTAVPAPQ